MKPCRIAFHHRRPESGSVGRHRVGLSIIVIDAAPHLVGGREFAVPMLLGLLGTTNNDVATWTVRRRRDVSYRCLVVTESEQPSSSGPEENLTKMSFVTEVRARGKPRRGPVTFTRSAQFGTSIFELSKPRILSDPEGKWINR